jgi:hypothetical protein
MDHLAYTKKRGFCSPLVNKSALRTNIERIAEGALLTGDCKFPQLSLPDGRIGGRRDLIPQIHGSMQVYADISAN